MPQDWLRIEDAASLEDAVNDLCQNLASMAPVTLRATREMLRRLTERDYYDSELIAEVYGSHDFAEGVSAFVEKRAPIWTGK